VTEWKQASSGVRYFVVQKYMRETFQFFFSTEKKMAFDCIRIEMNLGFVPVPLGKPQPTQAEKYH